MAAVLGVVGGGQLARMMALDAARLGIDVRVLAGERDEGVRGLLTVVDGAHDDIEALRRLAAQVDVMTFDHELVPLEHVRALEADGVVVRPSADALQFADKLHQRRAFAQLGLPLPPFAQVSSVADVEAFAAEHGWPVVLKAAWGGYDGRGVAVVEDADGAAGMVRAAAGRDLLAEAHLDLVRELAVLVVTGPEGGRVVYDPVESVQVEGMCREIHAADGHIAPALADAARQIALQVADAVGAVGVLAIELFVVSRERGEEGVDVLVNEIAPRPHNSGHHTIDGCATSQFANHVRAVLGLPLGPATPTARATVMVNVVGGDHDGDPRELVGAVEPGVAIHLYDKTPKPGRKVGHVTVVGDDHDEVAARARRAAEVLESDDAPPHR
jgi:5-(carboxyamino)imidazole ribonucleotide synthase